MSRSPTNESPAWKRYAASVLLAAATFFPMQPASAVYNANMTGIVTWVATYTEGDFIYFQLSNQPTTHPQCNPTYFVITEDVPQNRRNQLFAQLLTAKETREPINIGYDNAADCAHGYIRVHRVG